MNIAVVGSRTFTNYALVCRILDEYADPQDTIVSGGARGADRLARRYAKEHGLKLIEYFPEWKKHGRVAGFIRNELILKDAQTLFAFWDGESSGTQHSIKLAEKKGIRTYIIEEEDDSGKISIS